MDGRPPIGRDMGQPSPYYNNYPNRTMYYNSGYYPSYNQHPPYGTPNNTQHGPNNQHTHRSTSNSQPNGSTDVGRNSMNVDSPDWYPKPRPLKIVDVSGNEIRIGS